MRGILIVLLVACLALTGCSGDRGEAAPGAPGAETASASSGTRPERPLPSFRGSTLDGQRLDLSSLIGRRLLLVLFNPRAPEAGPMLEAATAVAEERGAHNFEIVGVAMGASLDEAHRFIEKRSLGFQVLDDTRGEFASSLGLRSGAALLVVDASGYVVTGTAGFPQDAIDPVSLVETEIREWLRLPKKAAAGVSVMGERPLAPDFKAERLEGGSPFELASTRGRPLALIFFLHTCPHCHHALEFLRDSLAELPEAGRPALVGVSITANPRDVRASLEEMELDFFPVVFDPDSKIRAAYGAQSSVPVLYLIDTEGRIASRVAGWNDERDPPLTRMRLARLAGQTPPMLLHSTGYSGNEFCTACHEQQHDTWLLTRHASAYSTLLRHGSERDPECIGCHVVGFEEAGGYSLDEPVPHLEDVGCETCHGRGGPHLSPSHVSEGNYEAVCVTCHDSKHSLGFRYSEFVPRVSHAANAHLTGLSIEEKRKLLADRRKPRSNLLPTSADYVGSTACAPCHAKEHETWSKQPHARALASLPSAESAKPDCLRCHTTGYGLKGGFPAGGAPADHPARVGVGCESCHGPGGEHVKADSPKIGSVVSLGDKCDSCVILQICGGCHDDANDPGFEFEVQEKIDRQRHGTIEAGTGRPKASDAAQRLPEAAWPGLLSQAFQAHDAGGS